MPSCPWLWQLSDLRVGGGRLHLDRLEMLPGITVITGPSGAGKSTLLGVLTGFVATGAGRVERAPAGDRLPMFWACGGLALWPGVSASQQLTLAGPSGFDPAPLLTAYALDHRADIAPELLSAGERDRLDVARAVASGADVLVLDEPFAH